MRSKNLEKCQCQERKQTSELLNNVRYERFRTSADRQKKFEAIPNRDFGDMMPNFLKTCFYNADLPEIKKIYEHQNKKNL